MAELTAIQPLLAAVPMLCVSLVQGAATPLGMIFNRNHRDWHTADAQDDLPQTKSGIQLNKESHQPHGGNLGLVPRIPVGTPRALANHPLESKNPDSRHKAETDHAHAVTQEADEVRGGGRGPVLRVAQTHTHRSALTRAGWTPAFAADAVEKSARVKA